MQLCYCIVLEILNLLLLLYLLISNIVDDQYGSVKELKLLLKTLAQRLIFKEASYNQEKGLVTG